MRWSYWVAAVKMGVSNVWLGYGPGSFGVVYPRFKLDWGGQTQLAHSHFLQIFAEGGLFALTGWIAWWFGWIFSKRNPYGGHSSRPILRWGIAVGLIAFLAHGLVDFDFFVPGITIQALFLCATLWAGESAGQEVSFSIPRTLSWSLVAGLAFLLVALPYRHFHRVGLAQGYFAQSVSCMEAGRWAESQRLLESALEVQPRIPSYHFYRGVTLEKLGDREAALAAYRMASSLAPNVSYYHYCVARLTMDENLPQASGDRPHARRDACG